jgi:hypothetical protein
MTARAFHLKDISGGNLFHMINSFGQPAQVIFCEKPPTVPVPVFHVSEFTLSHPSQKSFTACARDLAGFTDAVENGPVQVQRHNPPLD